MFSAVGSLMVDSASSLWRGLDRTKRVVEIMWDVARSFVSPSYLPDKTVLAQVIENRWEHRFQLARHAGPELVSHIRAFGEFNTTTRTVTITDRSMYIGMLQLGVDEKKAKLIVAASKSLPHLMGYLGSHFSFSRGIYGSFPAELGPDLKHPFSTGLYDREGYFQAERFALYKQFAVAGPNGELAISKESFNQCAKSMPRPSWENSTWRDSKDLYDAGFGYAGNIGEIDNAFDVLADKEINGVPHVSLDRLEQFYRDTFCIMMDRQSVCEIPPATVENYFSTTCSAESPSSTATLSECFSSNTTVTKPAPVERTMPKVTMQDAAISGLTTGAVFTVVNEATEPFIAPLSARYGNKTVQVGFLALYSGVFMLLGTDALTAIAIPLVAAGTSKLTNTVLDNKLSARSTALFVFGGGLVINALLDPEHAKDTAMTATTNFAASIAASWSVTKICGLIKNSLFNQPAVQPAAAGIASTAPRNR